MSKDKNNCDLRLNIGCGPIHAAGWVNIDGSNRAWLASKCNWLDTVLVRSGILPPTEFSGRTLHCNVLRGVPFKTDSVSAVYCGEVLEHFTKAEATQFMREVIRILKPGGVFRARVPDNYRFWKNYLSEFESELSKPCEERSTSHSRWIEMFFHDICVRRMWLGSYGHFHKWMYDEISLAALFCDAGFEDIERKSLNDSQIPTVELVETHEDLTMEGVKPGRH